MFTKVSEFETRLIRANQRIGDLPNEEDRFRVRFTLDEVESAWSLGLRRLVQAERLIEEGLRKSPRAQKLADGPSR